METERKEEIKKQIKEGELSEVDLQEVKGGMAGCDSCSQACSPGCQPGKVNGEAAN